MTLTLLYKAEAVHFSLGVVAAIFFPSAMVEPFRDESSTRKSQEYTRLVADMVAVVGSFYTMACATCWVLSSAEVGVQRAVGKCFAAFYGTLLLKDLKDGVVEWRAFSLSRAATVATHWALFVVWVACVSVSS